MTDFGNRRILAQPRGNVVEDRDADLERHQPPPDVATKFAAIGSSLFMISGNAGAQRKKT